MSSEKKPYLKMKTMMNTKQTQTYMTTNNKALPCKNTRQSDI